jgi:hypothetical protein
MIVCAYTFSIMATKYEYVNGIVDYADVTMGSKYGYYVGWFMATIYYPTLTSVLAWVYARYACVLLGFDIVGPQCMTIACFFLIGSYALNALSPILAGKFQVSATVIKLVPLLLMAVVGTIVGLTSGMTAENFSTRRRYERQSLQARLQPCGHSVRVRGLDYRDQHQRGAQGRQAQPAQSACAGHAHRDVRVYPLLHRPGGRQLPTPK